MKIMHDGNLRVWNSDSREKEADSSCCIKLETKVVSVVTTISFEKKNNKKCTFTYGCLKVKGVNLKTIV